MIQPWEFLNTQTSGWMPPGWRWGHWFEVGCDLVWHGVAVWIPKSQTGCFICGKEDSSILMRHVLLPSQYAWSCPILTVPKIISPSCCPFCQNESFQDYSVTVVAVCGHWGRAVLHGLCRCWTWSLTQCHFFPPHFPLHHCFESDNKPLSFSLSVMMAKEKPPITVVGDVGGRIAIIVVRILSSLISV